MATGIKTGGRKKGVPNKATAAKQAEIAASGLTPLEFMLDVMRNEGNEQSVRMDAAKAAAPYVHPKLANIDAKIEGDVGLKVEIIRYADR